MMAVYAPDCKKDLDVYETFIMTVTKISWEGRRAGGKDFYITVGFNVELGLMCTDEDDYDELNEIYGSYVGKDGETTKGFKADMV